MATENKFQLVRGTKDLFGEDIKKFNYATEKLKEIVTRYNFEEIETPIFEFSEVYERNLGETSDIVSKEVYKFEDRGGNYLTLRPEFTAGIVRALATHGELMQDMPKKLFSYGPVFRYDRPQKGRQRQFHQVNCEIYGANEPMADVELISMAYNYLSELGLGKNVLLSINSLGCVKSREKYEEALIAYFKENESYLSETSKERLEKKPLRILDSKEQCDRDLVANAPVITDFYEPEAKEFFDKVLAGLELLGIEYKIDPMLVRGLDYYTSTVFEFITKDLGAQGTVLAGGRYDNLVGQICKKEASALGFGGGVERLMLLLSEKMEEKRPVAIIPVTEAENDYCLKLSEKLRNEGICTEFLFSGNMKKKFKKANQKKALYTLVIGGEETQMGVYTVKNFETGEEERIDEKTIVNYLKERL